MQEYLGTEIPAYRGFAYIVFDNLNLTEEGGRYPQVECEVVQTGTILPNGRIQPSLVSVGSIIKSIAGLAGLSPSQVDTSEINGYTVWGYYVTTAGDVRDMLKNLTILHPFFAIEQGSKIICRRRDRPKVATVISKDYLAARSDNEERPEDFNLTRIDEVQLPSEVELTFIDRARNYESSVLTFRSATAKNNNSLSFNLPICVDPKVAEIAAVRTLRESINAREQLRVTLPPAYGFLEPGDVISVETLPNQKKKFAIDSLNLGAALMIEAEASTYDANVYDSNTYDL